MMFHAFGLVVAKFTVGFDARRWAFFGGVGGRGSGSYRGHGQVDDASKGNV